MSASLLCTSTGAHRFPDGREEDATKLGKHGVFGGKHPPHLLNCPHLGVSSRAVKVVVGAPHRVKLPL